MTGFIQGVIDFIEGPALALIVLLPLLGAFYNGVVSSFRPEIPRSWVNFVGIGSVLVAFLLSIMVFAQLINVQMSTHAPPRFEYEVYEWFRLGFRGLSIPVRVAFVADSLSGVMLMVVTGIGLLIHVYSKEYMADDAGYARFFTYLNLFLASMLILILGSSLPLMFVGWEGVGLCSYLLIGFWYTTPAYAVAGKKAFIANRIGDFGVLIGMFILFTATNSFEFAEINEASASLTRPFVLFREPIGMTATIACLFLFLGCTGKSAQIPLFVWLPDAMAGPTPVSALIHAATMVTAGVYLCCRLSHVFVLSPTTMAVIAITGTLTALLAASIALVQNEMKKILAYSTVSQLGFMFAAVGCGAFAAGFLHVFTHAFFKACLFLGAGAVMHAVHAHGDADVRRLGGLAKKLPVIHATFLISCLAIAGFPLLSGFFSKDEILVGAWNSIEYFSAASLRISAEGAMEGSWVASIQSLIVVSAPFVTFFGLAVAALMTAYYMFRLYFLTFSGSYRSAEKTVFVEGEEEEDHGEGHPYDPHPHRPHLPIQTALIVLAVGAALSGYLGLPHLLGEGAFYAWESWFHGFLATPPEAAAILDAEFLGRLGTQQPEVAEVARQLVGEGAAEHGAEHGGHSLFGNWMALGFGTVAALGGMLLAFVLFAGGKGVPSWNEPKFPVSVLMNKWYVDELYDATILRVSRVLAIVSANVDKYGVDFLLTRAPSLAMTGGGWLFTRIQTGVVYVYGAVMVAGLAVVGWWFIYPHPQLQATVNGSEVTWVAARGLGYSYRWDANNDGVPESCTGHTCEGVFGPEHYRGLVLLARDMRPGEPVEIDLAMGETMPVPREYLGAWEPLVAIERDEGEERPEGVPEPHWPRLSTGFILRAEGAQVELSADEPEAVLSADSFSGWEGPNGEGLTVRFDGGEVSIELPEEAGDVLGGVVSGDTVRFASGGRVRVGQTDLIVQPAVRVESGGAPIVTNGTRIEAGVPRLIGPGQSFRVGPVEMRVGVLVEGTVEVINAFDHRARDVVETIVEPVRIPPRAASVMPQDDRGALAVRSER